MQLTNDDYFLSQCGSDTARNVACLGLEIYARVPVLPRALFANSDSRPGHEWDYSEIANFGVRDHILYRIM